MEEPRRELHLFFAVENSTAVILYRAKSSLYRLISWDTKGDTFFLGQWIKTRVFEPACAVSADGKYFVYSAMHRGTPDVFTALSIAPYFTALEFKTGLTSFDAGGYFVDKDTVTFHHTMSDGGTIQLDCGLRQDTDWKNWSHCRNAKDAGISYHEQIALRESVQSKRGKITSLLDCYECVGSKLFRKTAEGLELLLDCSFMQFEAIKAPYDGCSPVRPERWHSGSP
ncbi:hypothetical protein [Leisingera sp. JC11]|uniref:hypothetical protein n=1 Tax=Leisingera sp. JC11 TaxID=3042469 RepID=UPI003451406F